MLCQTRSLSAFGAVLIKRLSKDKNFLVADREASVLSVSATRGATVYGWAGGPDYACMWTDVGVSVGCDEEGHIALFLDSSLEFALLQPSMVFGNPYLVEGALSGPTAQAQRVEVVGLEIYKF